MLITLLFTASIVFIITLHRLYLKILSIVPILSVFYLSALYFQYSISVFILVDVAIDKKYFVQEWEILIPVLTQAIGGVLIGKITKLYGSLYKSFGIIIGLVLNSLIQPILDQSFNFTLNKLASIILTITGLYIHTTGAGSFGFRSKKQKQ